jgi:predicted AAA+ superfamily ATPase
MSNLAWVNNKELNDSEFYNRTEEISNIKALLNLTANGNAPSLLVTGIRNVGKTVFLNKIKKDMENEYLIIYMDFSRAECYQKNNMNPTGLLEYYYKETINECKKKNLVNFDYRLKKYFKTNDFHIKDIKKIDILPLPIISSEKNFENLKDFIFNLPNEIYNDYKDTIKGIIIIIDEIQVIKELNEYLESFLWILRSYTQKHNHIAYVFSGSMSLQDELIPQI